MALSVAVRAFIDDDGAWSLEDVKAALLYADELAVALILTDASPLPTDPFGPGDDIALGSDGTARPVFLSDDLRPAITAGVAAVRPNLHDFQQHEVGAMLRAARGGVLAEAWWEGWHRERHDVGEGRKALVPAGYIPMWGETPPETLGLLAGSYDEFLDQLRHDEAPGADAPPPRVEVRAVDVAELRLAAQLLCELPAFPHADTADILDVRQRLHDTRTRFRGVMTAAGRELAEVPPEEFAAAAAAYRREHVDPAVLDIREQLEELRAVPTLLRTVKEPWAVPTIASLMLATSMLDPSAVLAAGGSATTVALAAREALTRRQVGKQVRQQPFWYLREVNVALDKRTRSQR